MCGCAGYRKARRCCRAGPNQYRLMRHRALARPPDRSVTRSPANRAAPSVAPMMIETSWRGEFTNNEANRLHAEAFETRLYTASEWDWESLVQAHSLGWVTARSAEELVSFVNVVWDGLVHAWVQ